MAHPFAGRSLAVISDFNREERRYLFDKTRKLKESLEQDDRDTLEEFRINDPDFGIYEVFLEDSTRTKESFKHAALFHRAKLSALSTDSSSFNKGESYADTFNNLAGYDNRVFIIRSKLEGVCRWLERAVSSYTQRNNLPWTPSFINAGDGRHEHPTQELLDEFTFLEDNNWDYSSIHVALVGDLYHGRTVHSKADGLQVFDDVQVDLIAPDVLEMPPYYVQQMKSNGYRVRVFSSIEEYLSQDHVARKWYFTRPQLERMGDRVLKRQDELRDMICFQRRFLPKLPEGTIFYHPLPRNKDKPELPVFLDSLPLNGWERQSANGRLVRIILVGMLSGLLGEDFRSQRDEPVVEEEEFIEHIDTSDRTGPKRYSEGVHPINEGIVIDHICKGDTSQEIREHMGKIVSTLELHGKGGEWVSTSQEDESIILKGIIFRPGHPPLKEKKIRQLAAIAPGCTLNVISSGAVREKYRLHTPPKLYGIRGLTCKNDLCISSPDHHEGVTPHFVRTEEGSMRCLYCDTTYSFKEVWR